MQGELARFASGLRADVQLLANTVGLAEHLPKALAVLTRVDPLTYGVDGVRAALIGVTHFGITLDILTLVGVATALLLTGAWRFSKIEI